jgi:hypothetical protein
MNRPFALRSLHFTRRFAGSARRTFFFSIMLVLSASSFSAPVRTAEPNNTEAAWQGPVDLWVSPNQDTFLLLTAEKPALWKWSPEGVQHLPLEDTPHRMKRLPDEEMLAVTCGGFHGKLLLIDHEHLAIRKRIPVGHTPCDVTIGRREGRRTAWVCHRFDGTVSEVDLEKGICRRTFSVGREPIALSLTPDGRRLMIAHHLPAMSNEGSHVASTVWTRDLESGRTIHASLLPGAMNVRDLAIDPTGRIAVATHLDGKFEHIPSHSDAGWINENMISLLNAETGQRHASMSLDALGYGAGNPWGLACSAEGSWLAVAHAGSCEITLLNLRWLRRPFVSSENAQEQDFPDHLPNQIRIPLPVKGLRRLCWAGQTLWACGFFDDTLACIRCEKPLVPERLSSGPSSVDPLPELLPPSWSRQSLPEFEIEGIRFQRDLFRFTRDEPWSAVRRGAMLFHDATGALESWHSCQSCHPDGRSDALNWDLLNDGLNNPKNTKSLLLSHRTPPAMATGVRATAEIAVRSGIEHILFSDFSESDAQAIDAYLRTLEPVKSPFLDDDGELTASARRGKRLFERPEMGCSRCHPAPLFTDLRNHDVGTSGPRDHRFAFDTPTLIEVWRTAPYLHDGRYATLRQVLVEGKHGHGEKGIDRLSSKDMDDLIMYIRSL